MRQVQIHRRRARRRDPELIDQQPPRAIRRCPVTADPAATLARIDALLAGR